MVPVPVGQLIIYLIQVFANFCVFIIFAPIQCAHDEQVTLYSSANVVKITLTMCL